MGKATMIRFGCLIIFLALLSDQALADHKLRIFATPERVAALKKAIAVKGSHHADAFKGLKTYVDSKGRKCFDPKAANRSYDRSTMAMCSAMMYQLKRHMQIVYGPKGYSQEGVGYTGYGCSFLLPACYALADQGDDTLVKELARHAFWHGLMFHGTSRMEPGNKQRIHLMQGVGGWTINDEGWASAALNMVPKEDVPYYLWFYDRHMGIKAPGQPHEKYDNQRGGFLWALLYYPTGVTPRDPALREKEARSIGDKNCGVYLFRNRWKDQDDIMTFICTDLQNHRAWDKREATQVGLHAYGTMFFGGPSKGLGKGVDTSHTFSRVLIDGKADGGRKSGKNGQNIAYEPTKNGGYVIAGGGSTYKSMGVDLVRHYLVDFSVARNGAILSTLDKIKAEAEHTYAWNGNLGTQDQDDGIKVSGGNESGRQTFTLQGHNGWVKGWVMHPVDAQLETSKDPLRVSTKGSNADIWVVMLVGSGNAPAGKVSGKGLGSTLSVAGKMISYNAEKDRVICK